MNKLKNSILLLLLSALPYLISSQVPDRFEFLAHNAKRNIVSQIILKDDHIVFSTNKGLEKARFDYDIENLASVNSFMDIKKSKLVELNDSTYHFIYWGIEDADIPELPGFRFYSNRNGIVSSGSRGINDFNYINDITPDSTGGFCA